MLASSIIKVVAVDSGHPASLEPSMPPHPGMPQNAAQGKACQEGVGRNTVEEAAAPAGFTPALILYPKSARKSLFHVELPSPGMFKRSVRSQLALGGQLHPESGVLPAAITPWWGLKGIATH